MDLLETNMRDESCARIDLFAENGGRCLDFLSSYGVHNTSHHLRIAEALKDELDGRDSAMLQSAGADR